MKKAYAYLRVSGNGQIDGDGFDRQEKAIRDFAMANGYEIAEVYREEGVSGSLADRPALAEMLVDFAENGHGIKTLIIEDANRLARDLMIQETVIQDLRESGAEVLAANGGMALDDDPTRKLVRQVLGAIAEYDKTMTVQKLRAARERKKAKTGKCEGRKGYAELAPETIREIKRLNRKPRGGRKKPTAKQIAETLNRTGHTTADGKAFTGNNVGQILFRLRRGLTARIPARVRTGRGEASE